MALSSASTIRLRVLLSLLVILGSARGALGRSVMEKICNTPYKVPKALCARWGIVAGTNSSWEEFCADADASNASNAANASVANASNASIEGILCSVVRAPRVSRLAWWVLSAPSVIRKVLVAPSALVAACTSHPVACIGVMLACNVGLNLVCVALVAAIRVLKVLNKVLLCMFVTAMAIRYTMQHAA